MAPKKAVPTKQEGDANNNDTEENGTRRSTRRRGREEAAKPPAGETEAPSAKKRRGRKGTVPPDTTSAGMLAPPDEAVGTVIAALPAARVTSEGLASTSKMMDPVVKVFCTHTEPNFSLPWQRKRQYSSSSSGFVISGRRILTNAHCVDHHTQVKIKRRGCDKKYVATVLSTGTECDIAMLTVEDDTFWQGLEPVVFGELPSLQDAVTVIGFPIGGESMSVTSGVVSRIEVTSYVHGAAELLGMQIDAAINSGNSGGPAFNEAGQCVGIAFQSLKNEDAENTGYVIPTPVVEHFINDYERNGEYTGFPALGIEWQRLENPYLRKCMGMATDAKGVLIRRVEPTAPSSKSVATYDILMSFDGMDISNDGTIPFRSGERISFSYLVSRKYTGEQAKLRILHKGKEKTVTVTLGQPQRLIPFHIKQKPPSYFIVAGLVFTRATVPYMRSEYGKDYDFDAPVKLLDKMMHAQAEFEGQQVVVLSQVLAADINIGYEEILNTQVRQMNGAKIKNLAHLVELVDGCEDEYLHLDLDYNQKVVLDRKDAASATKEILDTHCIPSDRSVELQELQAAKK